MDDVDYPLKDEVIGCGQWHRGFGWELRQHIANAFPPCVPKPNVASLGGFEGWTAGVSPIGTAG